MNEPALRVVEGSSMEEPRALSAALSQIRASVRQGLDHAARARTTSRWTSRPFPPAHSAPISRSALAACRAAVWSRSMVLSARQAPLALHAVAQAQKKGGVCAFIDAEHALDPE